MEARQFFFLNYEETPSLEEHKTIFSGLRIWKMALSNQIDSPPFFVSVRRLTKILSIPDYDNPLSPLPVRRPYAAMF
jgi:hypothetical protein